MCPLFHCLLLNNTEIQRISKTCPKWEVMLLIVVQVAKHVIFENLQMIYVFKQQMKACKCINGYKNTSMLSLHFHYNEHLEICLGVSAIKMLSEETSFIVPWRTV